MRSAKGCIENLGPNYYRVWVTGTVINPATGKPKRYSQRVRGSRVKAEEVQRELELEAGNPVSGMSVQEYGEKVFLKRKRAQVEAGKLKQRTVESYSDRLRLYVYPVIGTVEITSLRPVHIRKVMNATDRDSIKREARRVLSVMCQEAVYDELLPSNPVKSVRPAPPSEYEPTVLDREDMEVYLWHFRDTRVEPAVLLAMGGAYRRGEIIALNVEDIDFETGRVIVDDAIIQTRHGDKVDTRKNHKPLVNYLPPHILKRLEEILPPSGPVIASKRGGPLGPSGVAKLYSQTLETLPEGVPRIPLKNLRHSTLTAIYDATGDIARARDHGGHLDQHVTERYYVRQHEDQARKLAGELDRYLFDGVVTNGANSAEIDGV